MNIKSFIKIDKFKKALNNFNKIKPFPYVIVDDFLNINLAKTIEKNFPNLDEKKLWSYKNYCEIKKATDNWNLFPPQAYQLLSVLNSHAFLEIIKKKIKIKNLYADYGLNGGGFHIMGEKGKLNPHLDYVIHPKLNLMRKFNLIIFFNLKWKQSNGGELCLYEKNYKNKRLPGKLVKKIEPKFNRAVLFDTSQTSWHGVNEVKNMIRKSMAVYYLVDKKLKTEKRYKALYSPLKNQMNNKKVKMFIKMRANPKYAFKVAKI
jgi:Rps23 Pro-64 3,4-dihydroxylase Tpa1-like proline 4-hydroxylase